MGEILICRRSGENDEPAIALKTFQQRFFFQPAIRSAFLREVRLWSRLSGVPHIMPVLGFQVLDGRPYVVMPAVVGPDRTLRELLAAGPLGLRRAALLAAQILCGRGERSATWRRTACRRPRRSRPEPSAGTIDVHSRVDIALPRSGMLG
jgi:serine/threonine protein kinase